jgi:hypothetical protein
VEKWRPRSRAANDYGGVADPEAIARVAYIVRGRPYFIDVPFPR